MFSKKSRFLGMLGFLGFVGFQAFRYFGSGNVNDLTYIGFFGFFAFFFIAKISGNRTDERYVEDVKIAKAFMGNLAFIEITMLMILGVKESPIREYLFILVSACFASLIISYAVKLYILEER
ncbi:DUF3796 domain-containing protein [Aminipila sp.]|uniref:DUF3796 domain-containing protein n=1 Tax=Aminipila sp. TaxID=2060095 RepID=UPI0028A2BAD1|nr:DUF3796 domain-containing protein [Aminipila sp.]